MIIIKTTNGDVFVNENDIVSVTHNREVHTAFIDKKEILVFQKPPIEHVESVKYINDQTGKEWEDTGSQVAYLQEHVSKMKEENNYAYKWINELEDALRDFASEMIQIVQYHHEQIPDDICKQMRDHGEDMKRIVSADGITTRRRQWIEALKAAEVSEDDKTHELYKTIEDQDATIRQMKDEIQRMKNEQRMSELFNEPTEYQQPSLWEKFKWIFYKKKKA